MPLDTARIARTIAELYAAEPTPEELAEQLAHVAAARAIPAHVILLWLHDRPRHELSTAHFLRWCQRHHFAELLPA